MITIADQYTSFGESHLQKRLALSWSRTPAAVQLVGEVAGEQKAAICFVNDGSLIYLTFGCAYLIYVKFIID